MTPSSNLAWYRHRLAAMSVPEIAHRVVEKAKRHAARTMTARLAPAIGDLGTLPALPGLRENLLAWDMPDALVAQWEETLAQTRNGSFYLLGQQWPESMAPPWHLDPVTGKQWPSDQYCFAIDFRHTHDFGDIKYVWEVNRLQHLQVIAALAARRGDAGLAQFCLGQLEGWIDCNPPHKGVNWASGIELGLRVVSILAVTTLIGEHLTAAQRAKVWTTLNAHGVWLARYPSLYSSANNHLTAEGLGLFLLGALCTALPDATRWKQAGWKDLHDTARLQILPDGVGAEQTLTYTAVVLEMLMLGLVVAEATGHAIEPLYRERIALGGNYLRWFTDEGGNQPFIGDNDNARVFGIYRRDEPYVRDILGSIAAITGDASLTPPHATPHFRNAVFGLPPQATPGPQGVRVFSDGGYTVGRRHGRMLAFDHGYLGYLGIAAHGHADALSVWLHVGEQPVLIDAGTYLYHSGGAWRRHFRGTAAHNTLTLEEADQSLMAGHFNWSHKANARQDDFTETPDGWSATAEHDGYLKRFGVTHHRRLISNDTTFVTEDWLQGTGSHKIKIGFLIHPSLDVSKAENGVDIGQAGKRLLALRPDAPHEMQIESAWYSDGFGIKVPAQYVALTCYLAVDTRIRLTGIFDA